MLNIKSAFPRGSGGFRFPRGRGLGRGRGALSGRGRMNHTTKPTTHFQRHGVLQCEKEMDVADVQQPITAAYLSLRTIRPGMLVLGCVKHVSSKNIELCLPGRIKAMMPATSISDEYSARLQNVISSDSKECPTLREMYKTGDLIYVKVVGTVGTVGTISQYNLNVTGNPRDLHSDFAPAQLVPGLVLSATIVAKEDRGYLMNVGIGNVRAFLPEENLGENQNDIGRNLACSVEQVSQLSLGATIVLKAFNPNSPWVLNVEEASLETVVPGCRLPFTVGEPVEHGLRGMIFEDTVPAYVNELMLTKATSTPKKYTMFKKIPATLLYVMPLTKQVFVSLRPYPNNRIEVDVANGRGTNIENACVKSVNSAGVWLQFENKYRALLPRKLLLKQAAQLGNVDESVVMGNYQIGTTHKVSVTQYEPLMDIYVVNNDPALFDTEIRSADDIIIGKTYNCYVTKADSKKVRVNVGFAQGSLENELYYLKNKLKMNERGLVRAVSRAAVTWHTLFTNHPLLLSEKAMILQDWNQLDASRKDQRFHGIVSSKCDDGFVIKFFNHMSGILKTINAENDPTKLSRLHVGGVELFTVTEFDKATQTIHLLLPCDSVQIKHDVVDATITCLHATGVDVRTDDGETGTIPSECFSEFGEHNSLYMRLLQEGKTIPVMKTHSGTYSYRLKEYFKTHPMLAQSVVKGALLKGNCITVNGIVYVTPLLSNYSERFVVNGPVGHASVSDGSTIMMRVKNVHKTAANRFQLQVNTLLEHVCANGINEVHEFVAAYMRDVDDLIQRYQEQHFTFANFTIGQHVECVVESIVPNSEKLAIEVHAIDKKSKYVTKGIATAILPNKPATSYKVGSKVPGRVVWIDVERMLVHVCLDQSLFECIALNGQNDSQTTITKEPQECWVLFANKFVHVCCLKHGPAQLLIVPVKHHYNEIRTTEKQNADKTLKVKLIKPIGSMFLAMREEMVLQFGSLIDASNKMYTTPSVESTPQNSVKSPSLIRCRQAPGMFNDDGTTNYSDESENDSEDEEEQEEKHAENGTEDEVDNDDYYSNDNSNDEQITTKKKNVKKGKASSSNGNSMLASDDEHITTKKNNVKKGKASSSNGSSMLPSDDEHITRNEKNVKKGKVSSSMLLSKNGKLKSSKQQKNGKLKRKLADKTYENEWGVEAAETNGENGNMLPLKKKKKKTHEISSHEDDQETVATVAIVKKKAKKAVPQQSLSEDEGENQSTKKSLLFVEKTQKATKTKLKK